MGWRAAKAFDELAESDPMAAARVVAVVRWECRVAGRAIPYPFA